MSNGIILPAILFLTALASMPDTTLSGRLRAHDTGSWLGGEDAYVVAFAESPGSAKDLVVLGYAHPDVTGKWTITGLPSTGNIYVSGFHRGFPAILFYAIQRRIHQRERFFLPALPGAQPLDRLRIDRICDKEESAQPFNSDNFSLPDRLGRFQERLVPVRKNPARGVPELQARAANGARVRLGMETPVSRILILFTAIRAHLEELH